MIGQRYAIELTVSWDHALVVLAGVAVHDCIEATGWLWQPQDETIYSHESVVEGECLVSAVVQPMQLALEHEMDDEIVAALLVQLRARSITVRGISIARYVGGSA